MSDQIEKLRQTLKETGHIIVIPEAHRHETTRNMPGRPRAERYKSPTDVVMDSQPSHARR